MTSITIIIFLYPEVARIFCIYANIYIMSNTLRIHVLAFLLLCLRHAQRDSVPFYVVGRLFGDGLVVKGSRELAVYHLLGRGVPASRAFRLVDDGGRNKPGGEFFRAGEVLRVEGDGDAFRGRELLPRRVLEVIEAVFAGYPYINVILVAQGAELLGVPASGKGVTDDGHHVYELVVPFHLLRSLRKPVDEPFQTALLPAVLPEPVDEALVAAEVLAEHPVDGGPLGCGIATRVHAPEFELLLREGFHRPLHAV